MSVSLMEQENLKELFRILGENRLDKEKSQFMELADYINNMDQQ